MEDIEVKSIIPASAARIFAAWLDGPQHAAMTGAPATGSPTVGGKFTAWEGYISGKNLEIEPDRRIVQAWRSTEFPKRAKDSRVEVRLAPHADGTEVTIVHTAIPKGQGESYRKGWEDFYFKPMRAFFGSAGGASTKS